MEDRFAMVNECSNMVSSGNVPNPHSRIGGTRYYNTFIVLQTEYRTSMSRQNSETSQTISVPHFDGVVSKSRDNFLIIILETINTFGIFRAAINPLQIVFATSPIILYGVNVLNY